jgi:hypothetical protein
LKQEGEDKKIIHDPWFVEWQLLSGFGQQLPGDLLESLFREGLFVSLQHAE